MTLNGTSDTRHTVNSMVSLKPKSETLASTDHISVDCSLGKCVTEE